MPDHRFLDDDKYRAAYRATPSPFGGAEVVFAGAAGEVTAIAGGDGRYDLRLAPGRYRVYVRGDNAVSAVDNLWYEPPSRAPRPGTPRLDLALPVELSADVVGLDLPVLQVGQIAGQVVAHGRPVAGAVVRQGSNAAVIAGTDSAVTDAAGRYQLVASPGPRTVQVSHPGFAPIEGPWLYLDAGKRIDFDVTLRAGRAVTAKVRAGRPSLSGVVLRRDGTPVPAAQVLAVATSPLVVDWQYAVTDAHGHFVLRDLVRGPYRVTAVAPGDGLASAEVTLPRRELRIELSGTTRIEGTSPHLREGAFLLRLRDPDPQRDLDRLVPVHEGRFAVDGIPATFARIDFEWQDQTGWFAIDPRRPSTRVDIILGAPQPKRVTGTIRFLGKPVAGSIAAPATPGAVPTRVAVGPDGRFALDTYSGAMLDATSTPDCDLCAAAIGEAQVSAHTGRDERLDVDLEVFDVGED
ncbi:MAG TPA: carboxypeptidase-like regulatory domain-containing protein [Kofleriaceae bacterium]|nr:carboxypeptidase-like regulatory domain-containing protein [Kofleriaceae bacterium]